MACYLLLMAGVYWTSFIIKIYNYKRCGENTDRRLNKPRYQLAFYLFLCQLKTTNMHNHEFHTRGSFTSCRCEERSNRGLYKVAFLRAIASFLAMT